MKKAVVMMMVAVMVVMMLSASAFAMNAPLTLDQAKQVALNYAGVNASDAVFTKAYQDWDDGRQVYEFEFYAGNMEYEMDVDVNTGRVRDFSTEYFYGGFNAQPAAGGYNAPSYNGAPNGYYYDDDMYDWDDRYDFDDRFDFDDWFDFD